MKLDQEIGRDQDKTWVFKFDREFVYLWHGVKIKYNNRIHAEYNNKYNLHVFLCIILCLNKTKPVNDTFT